MAAPTPAGEVYNLASGSATRIGDLARSINDIAGNRAGLAFKPRTDDIREPQHHRVDAKHVRISGDHRLRCQLARSVGRNRDKRSELLVHLEFTLVSVHTGTRGVRNPSHLVDPHRFQDVVRKVRALPEVDCGICHRQRDLGVRGEEIHVIASAHGVDKVVDRLDVPDHELKPFMIQHALQMRFCSRCHVVIHDNVGIRPSEQRLDEMTSDEAGSSGYEGSRPRHVDLSHHDCELSGCCAPGAVSQ